MSDMPPPYALAEYTKPSNGKIKIKMPTIGQPVTSTPASHAPLVPSSSATQPSSASPLVLRVPASTQGKLSSEAIPATNSVSTPVALAPPLPPAAPSPVAPAAVTATSSQSTSPHYPNIPHVAPAAPSTLTSTSNIPVIDTVPQAHSTSHSPAPSSSNPLKSTSLTVQPSGRSLALSYQDGVKCWAMWLVPGETEVHVDRVVFLNDEEEEESSGEEEEHEAEGKDVDEEQAEDVSSKTIRKKGRGKGKRRTKSAKGGVVKATAAQVKRKKPKASARVTLNGTLVKEQADMNKWVIQPSTGMNVLEVGESGGILWKVYIQRSIV